MSIPFRFSFSLWHSPLRRRIRIPKWIGSWSSRWQISKAETNQTWNFRMKAFKFFKWNLEKSVWITLGQTYISEIWNKNQFLSYESSRVLGVNAKRQMHPHGQKKTRTYVHNWGPLRTSRGMISKKRVTLLYFFTRSNAYFTFV